MCHSVHKGLCLFPACITGHMTRLSASCILPLGGGGEGLSLGWGGSVSWGVCIKAYTPPHFQIAQPAGDTHTTGMHTCSIDFSTGKKDAVRCFHCDGSLCNWEHAHDPFTEHARWYPHCAFIKSINFEEGKSSQHAT